MTRWIPDIAERQGPRYRAIADALAEDVRAGRLPPGTRLPTHRDLALRLGVTTGTITRAYAEAERRGLVGGEVGRGTYVRGAERPVPSMPEPREPADDGLIDLSVGQPAPIGIEGIMAEAAAKVTARPDFEALLRYQPHAGMAVHRAAGASWLARHGLAVEPDRVLVCSGGQNAIALSLMALASAGDTILAEELTYPGLKVAAATLGLKLHPVTMDADGVVPEALEAAIRAVGTPRAFYTTPTLHNPTQIVVPAERRERIADIAQAAGVVIVEDDVFGFLSPEAPPTYAEIAPDSTIYLTSLTKSVAPGLRIGYMAAPRGLSDRLSQAIRAVSWMTSPFMAELARVLIESGDADRIADRHHEETLARQEIAREVLGPYTADMPAGAGYLWLRLPEPWRRESFTSELLRKGIKVAPADVFIVGRGQAPQAVRISLTAPTRETLRRGLGIIADLLESPGALLLPIV
ncbi:aminotransferase-like domain-containing protein [Arenibaculum pallidiluteum]|uniref:aminotransferase-like domain-containing protein n=1 Tax=Arenibaculum pallidiluteum TaxID=2812559 RepID=UPI001A972F1F|nr:PLP-dependent aminotransferase family protein [Arenibaculum pallidiluteum]